MAAPVPFNAADIKRRMQGAIDSLKHVEAKLPEKMNARSNDLVVPFSAGILEASAKPERPAPPCETSHRLTASRRGARREDSISNVKSQISNENPDPARILFF